jgi:hypothetical protein
LRELVEGEVEGEAGKVLTKVKKPMTLRSMVMRCIAALGMGCLGELDENRLSVIVI